MKRRLATSMVASSVICFTLGSTATQPTMASIHQISPVALRAESAPIYDEIAQALKASIIPQEDQKRVWDRAAFEILARKIGQIAAANKLLRRFGTSHTAVYARDETEFYDLIAVTLYGYGDPTPEVKRLFGDRAPTYAGIGVWYRPSDEHQQGRIIAQVFPGSPAEAAGLRAGDVVLAADHKPFEPISSFSGVPGRTVELEVLRGRSRSRIQVKPEVIDPLNFYARATERSVTTETIGGRSIGYVRPFIFYRREDMQFLQKLLTNGDLSKADALVIDLRGGWGATPMSFAEPFVGGLPPQAIETGGGIRRESNWKYCKPVVLLTDGTTRSGKEIFAAAMKLNGIPVVGETTAGQVLSTRAQIIRGGTAIVELPFANVWVGGVRIEGQGVSPTVRVGSRAGEADAIRETGLKVAATMTRPGNNRPICAGT